MYSNNNYGWNMTLITEPEFVVKKVEKVEVSYFKKLS